MSLGLWNLVTILWKYLSNSQQWRVHACMCYLYYELSLECTCGTLQVYAVTCRNITGEADSQCIRTQCAKPHCNKLVAVENTEYCKVGHFWCTLYLHIIFWLFMVHVMKHERKTGIVVVGYNTVARTQTAATVSSLRRSPSGRWTSIDSTWCEASTALVRQPTMTCTSINNMSRPMMSSRTLADIV